MAPRHTLFFKTVTNQDADALFHAARTMTFAGQIMDLFPVIELVSHQVIHGFTIETFPLANFLDISNYLFATRKPYGLT
ncbi:MAG TPA: hypothetical protein PL107_07865 [Candidatus Marinimicrobia bacterium]|jgi:hypothetical protein|nr:hypothetical protein [Candidatus Neomarinimicrobiota bacterium]HPB00337.1 hypothetical protein [Candidatus Neomarinimicrobiota bacterium]HQQ85525.1 hypothetical protein [Candidatus Neomarinimicrobiota bacterium]